MPKKPVTVKVPTVLSKASTSERRALMAKFVVESDRR